MKSRLKSQCPLWIALVILLLGAATTYSQTRDEIEAKWRFGLKAGLNYNNLALGYQQLAPPGQVSNFGPFVLVDGTGIGPYVGLLGEYRSWSWWGAQLRLSYDSRNGVVEDNTYPDIPKEFDISSSNLLIEPLLRVSFDPSFYVVAGPAIGINLSTTYDMTTDGEQTATDFEVTDMNTPSFGASFGLGYDLVLNDRAADLRWYLSPFVEGSWLAHQRGVSFEELDQDKFDDIWSNFTVRFGVSIKLGIMPPIDVVTVEDEGWINLNLFSGGAVRPRQIEEYFPLVTNVFFDSANAEVPARYRDLSPSDAQTFDETQISNVANAGPMDVDERKRNQMNVYYNLLNIYGARLRANPATRLTLIGSSPGSNDGGQMAENVKKYLTDIHGIDPSRITVEERAQPRKPSGSARTPAADRPLTEAENRRVELVTAPDDLSTPVRLVTLEASPIENDLVLNVDEGAQIREWEITIQGEGSERKFGPYTRSSQRLDPRMIIGSLDKGRYVAEVKATTNSGETLNFKKEFELVKKPAATEQARRYSIVFNYGENDPVKGYDKFLRETVAAQVQNGDRIYVIGHTDVIGDETVNYNLSQKRAKEVRDIISSELKKLGKKATFEVVGYGEAESPATFNNNDPEGRFYNRGVVIEVVPGS